MLKNKHAFLVLLSILICLVAISFVSASDNVTTDELTTIDDSQDIVLNSENNDISEIQEDATDSSKEILSSNENDDEISADGTEDLLNSPDFEEYSVDVEDVNVTYGNTIIIPVHISPSNDDLAYDFYVDIYDSNGYQKYSYNYYSSNPYTYIECSINPDDFGIGVYRIDIINFEDNYLMDSATLNVLEPTVENGTLTIAQSGSYYGQKTLTVKLTNLDSGNPMGGKEILLRFSNGKTATVNTNSKGTATYKVPFNAGTYTVQATASSKYIDATSSKVTVKILKHKASLTLSQSGRYYKDKTLTIKLYDSTTKSAIKYHSVKLKFSNGKTATAKTNSKGIATYKINFNPGKYSVTASVNDANLDIGSKKLSNIKIDKIPVKFNSKNLKTTYSSGKYFKIKVINKATKKAVKGVKIQIKVKGGKKYSKTSGSGGIIKIDATKMKIGKHKVKIKLSSTKFHSGKSKTNKIIIKKAFYKINVPNKVNAYKQNEKYNVKVLNKASGKAVKGVKVTMKVYTGKKVKTYKVKTNKNGIAGFSTKSLSKSKHKVVVSVKSNKFYKSAKAKGSVKISKKLKTRIVCDEPRAGGIDLYYNGYYYGTLVNHAYITAHVYDSNGKEIFKKVKFKNPDGEVTTGTSGQSTYISTGRGDITVTFPGDSKYFSSKTTVTI